MHLVWAVCPHRSLPPPPPPRTLVLSKYWNTAISSACFSSVSFHMAEISPYQHSHKSIFTLISYRLINGAENRVNGQPWHGAEVGGASVKQPQEPIKVARSCESTGRHFLHAGGNQDPETSRGLPDFSSSLPSFAT